ncbi:MAG: hypothetical protein K5917_06575 [Clostridiales bacterium]|nr:hypothetical protein [Clostridiales bacterium]
MDEIVKANMEKLLLGKINYTSQNLASNMLIKRLQLKVLDNPNCMSQCLDEIEAFSKKYPKITAVDFAKIAQL